jgi:hypothetical protein
MASLEPWLCHLRVSLDYEAALPLSGTEAAESVFMVLTAARHTRLRRRSPAILNGAL